MRLRSWFWILLCLLVTAGAWFFWPAQKAGVAEKKSARTVSTFVRSNSTAPNLLAGATTGTNANQTGAASVKTNRFAYRLANTTRPIGELVNDRHAILLENALIDTGSPLNLSIPKNLRSAGDPGAYIVQAKGPIDTRFRAALAQSGAQIVSYIPNDAYLVRLSAAAASALLGNALVQSVLPYEPYYKISASMPTTVGQRVASSTPKEIHRLAGPSLLTLALKQAPLPVGTYLTLGLFNDGAAATEAQIEKLGARIVARDKSPFGPVVRVQPPADWVALAALPGVQIVEPYRPRVHANDLSRATVGVAADTQVGTNYLNLTGAGVMVEVNDSGIDATHPDFSGGGPLRVFGNSPLSFVDTNGHGTHVAGIIAGDGTKSITVSSAQGSIIGTNGVAVAGQFRGMAPQATLFSVAAFGNGFGKRLSDQSLQEIPALTNALISNNSWNYDGNNAYDLAAASYDAATRDALPGITGSQPVLFVFSAGNDGGGDDSSDPGDGTPDTILSPATAKDVITVGAIQEHRDITNMVTTITVNSDGTTTTNTGMPWQPETSTSYRVAGFSARGNVGIGTEGTFGRYKPDVVAPGTFVISTRSSQWDIANYFFINPTNYDIQTYSNVIAQADSLWANVFPTIPNNTVGVSIEVGPNPNSPVPLPTMPIYAGEYTSPNVYDFSTTVNPLVIPGNPDATFTLQDILNTEGFWGFNYGVSNTTTEPISFNVTTDVITTNNPGDYYLVLSNLDQSIGTPNPNSTGPGPYYRYETGTSMSAADVSGVLALMQQYFTNNFGVTPSPALMKAALINGARVSNAQIYNLEVTNTINHEGWGLINLTNSLPGVIANQFNTPCDDFFVDQSPTNALATGDSHTYTVSIISSTNSGAQNLPLRVTLAWTDPPGNPAAAIKLVNSLELVVTNSDNPTNPIVYYGNDIGAGQTYNTPENPTNAVNVDAINNVQNVFIYPQPGANYSITVIGRQVNVNAVTAQTNNVVQDYALVVSCGEGEVTNAFKVADNPVGIVSNPTGGQQITFVTTTNQPLFNQFAGANTPLLGTNTVQYGSTNKQVTAGMTNQWHFYVVTNTGPAADFTNAVFITFDANTLSISREGVFANSQANSTRPQADIDLYVSTDPGLTKLDPVVLSNCVNGTQVGKSVAGTFNGASLSRSGTEFVVDTNSNPTTPEVYYVGVKSEDQMAAEYAFIPIFTRTPPSGINPNGDEVVNGLNVPVAIPDGSPALPGFRQVFGVAIYPIQVERVVVTNQVWHQNFGDLIGTLTLNGALPDVLNNHDSIGNTIDQAPLIYDDSGQNDIGGSHPSDGPGSLNSYVGQDGFGVWMLTEVDDSLTQTGGIQNFTLLIQPHVPLTSGSTNTIPGHSWFYDFIDVPAGYTNLSVFATNLPPTSQPLPLRLYLNVGTAPTFSNYLFEADLTNGTPPGNSISYGPPLQPARYWVGVYNPDSVPHDVYIIATLGGLASAVPPTDFSADGPPLLDDAVTTNSIFISNTQRIASVNIGLVVNHPRISDLTFTLVSPGGQRILLMENRGGDTTNGAGSTFTYTNVLNSTATGGAAANTNYLAIPPLGLPVPITYNFYTVPDEMTVYQGTNAANYYIGSPDFLFDTGFTNNPPAPGLPGAQNTSPVTITVTPQPGFTNITIIMNQFGNPYAAVGDAWIYTAGAAVTNYEYLMFTEDTNLATLPIKYAVPPFNFTETLSNYTFSDFEQATNGNYLAPANIYDPFGGWFMPTNKIDGTNSVLWTNNMVSVVTDPSDSLGDNVGSNFLALADGTIMRSIPTVPGRQYNVTFWYRGPGISGWWRGEGDASDSSQPEGGNNGSLIGRFNFPAGEVGQAFEFADAGADFEFAGTNTYVQIRQSPSLDVGAGGGFTVEGWINPTNVSRQMPLVEWLAKVPVFTNSPDTNFSIAAGPFLNRATGHYYYLLAATNWTTSEIWATNLGGHLATIETANEQNWVYDAFASFGSTNRNLWIGLTNGAPGTFVWSSGLTNIVYTNWANGQPLNCDSAHGFTFMFGNTNTPGLWTLADNKGFTCDNPAKTNQVYGVVEVNDIQTNGVQFWISATNTPGTTNAAFVSSNGCLYANLVDTTNGSHEIFSAPGSIQSGIYQHVALTYDTNSGLAMLYYNGTKVATTNLGVFVPKTGGDVLLGRDMSRAPNNYYGGKMDEMSIYSRALSGAEIAAIYQVSAFATNGLTGKFDPSVTPAYGLAEAQVSFGTTTNIIFGVNDQWELNSFTFLATSNLMPLQISGLEPGILLDSFTVSEAPVGNLYYLPEQSLQELAGDSAFGTWTLEIWDNRANAAVTAADAQLVNWQLQFILQTNGLAPSLALDPQDPATITVPPGGIVPLLVNVPSWASSATNILVSATGPVDLLFNPANPPTGGANDTVLINNQSAPPPVFGNPVLAVNATPPLLAGQAGQSYYLGVRNNGAHAVTAVVEVDFDITKLSNGVPVSGVLKTNDSERYFAFDVSSNAFEATFQLLNLSGNADLVVRKGPPLPTLFSSDYGSFNATNADENIYVLTNSLPVPLSAGRWYLGVFKRDAGPVAYTVLAKELDATNGTPGYTIIDLTNRVPFTFTAGPGAALTNFFRFNVTNTFFVVTNAASGLTTNAVTTNYLSSIHFELYNLSGNGDLTVQTNAPPFAPPFFESSQQPGTAAELIYIRTNSVLTNLVAEWYLGVPNRETNLITYTIVAMLDTNLVFPAFPGAEGAGAGAIGGRFGNVYHVVNLNDSGPGSLRAAVGVTNRTIVFDVSGTINLLSPLVITNSFLTIAGQTAPGGGITVAGQMTTVQNAHDVIPRYLGFRPGNLAPGDALQFTNVSDVIADHVSAEWSSDNLISVLNSTNVTVQWSVIADSLYNTNNPQGFGSVLRYGNGALSFHHNLYADNYSASPRLGDNLTLDFVNNVIYNWGIFAGFSTNDVADDPLGFTNELNYVCNYLIAGPNSVMTNIAFWSGTTNTWIFQTNNFIDSNTNGILDGADTEWLMFTNHYTPFQVPFPPLAVGIDEAYQAYERVLDFAGVNMDKRDAADTNIVGKVRSQTGVIIATAGTLPPLNSTPPYLDTDQDGIPDFWEITLGEFPTNFSANLDRDGDGYTDLEEYLNWLAGPHALTVTNTPVGVDLMQLFGKTGNLSFSVTNNIHGFVYLTNVLNYTNSLGAVTSFTNTGPFSNSIAVFTPTNNAGAATNYSGYASFDVYVTNNATIAYFGPVTVSVMVSAVFVTSVVAPFVFTQPAQAVTGTSAQLNGMATPNGLPTTAWFEWGATTNYGSVTPPVSVGSGYNVVYATSPISGLTANVPYHFRLVVSNAVAVVYGFDQILDEANVVAWGANFLGQAAVPPGLSNVTAIAGAYDHNLALKPNSTAVGWGDNTFGQMAVPPGLNNNLVAVAGGQSYSLALKSGGAVVAWGANIFPGETNVPAAALNGVVMIASGQYSSMALKNNGTIVAWGANISGLTNVPAGLSNSAVAIAGGSFHNLAIRNDGTVVAWGDDSAGQTDVPAGLTNVVAISGGSFHSLALKNDGAVVAWGDNSSDQTNVPAGLNNVVAVAAGGFHSLALKSDGTVVTWGDGSAGQKNVPPGLTNFVAIAAGNLHSLALTPQSIASLTNIVLNLTNGVPQTNNISSGGITYYQVNVPTNADFATNILIFTLNGSLNVWFSTNSPPSITKPGDVDLMPNATNGISVLSATSVPTNIVPGTTYYLGVQNTNSFAVNYGIEVDFHLLSSTNNPIIISSITYTNNGTTNGFLLTWFAPSNDLFQVQWNNNLASTNWQTFTNPAFVSYNTNFPASSTNAQFNFFDDGSQTGGTLGAMRFYRLILLQSTNPPPPTNTVSISGITYTNNGTTNGFLLTWFAPSNDLFQVQWTPSLAPETWATFTNPAVISYNTNVFTGGPTNTQFNFFDDGSQTGGTLGAMRFYRLILLQMVNTLTLPSQSNLVVTVSNAVTVTNTATDSNTNAVLTYILTNSPAGASISSNGIITWTNAAPAGSSSRFTTIVTDNGLPSLTASNTFTVFVAPFPAITNVTVNTTNVTLRWSAPTNDLFQVQWTTNLMPVVNWFPFQAILTSTNGMFTFTDTNAPLVMKFYRLILLP
jgi:subtilisin-like proprotein convertase family protein